MVGLRQRISFLRVGGFLFFVSAFISHPSHASRIIKCLSLLKWPLVNSYKDSQKFRAEHFPPAHFKALNGHNLLKESYSAWSAETANRISRYLDISDMQSAFTETAKARKQFEIKTSPDGDYMFFGVIKNSLSRHHSAFFGSMTLTPKEIFPTKDVSNYSRRAYTEEAARLYSEHLPTFENMQSYREVHSATNLDGIGLAIKQFEVDIRPHYNELLKAERVDFYSKSYGDDVPYQALVLAKIRAARALKNTNREEAFQEFALSMYAFFGSMPYMRGSAAIGRVVYTVLARKIFHKEIILDPEIDIRVLMRKESDFVDWLKQDFINQGVELAF
jgi:hypothetical protein